MDTWRLVDLGVFWVFFFNSFLFGFFSLGHTFCEFIFAHWVETCFVLSDLVRGFFDLLWGLCLFSPAMPLF